MRPRLLDLFSGAGGAARGYQLAGFHVTGVDIEPQPRYVGDAFHQADALEFPLDGFDAIHASPPCQRYTMYARNLGTAENHPDLLPSIRDRLAATGVPYVIENVPGAPMRPDIELCGCMFDLNIRRRRWFEMQPPRLALVAPCHHNGVPIGVYGNGTPTWHRRMLGRNVTIADWQAAMGIDWMRRGELAEAIPPPYAEFIGEQLMATLNERSAA